MHKFNTCFNTFTVARIDTSCRNKSNIHTIFYDMKFFIQLLVNTSFNQGNGYKNTFRMIKSFLYQVSRNNALNHLKHERVKSEYMAKGVQELESQVCFINYVIEEEAERILAETEQELAPKCREIFKLAMQGKDNEEIARLLGVSENTVKTQKKIAYKKLKQKIAEVTMLLLLLNQVVGE